MVHDQTTDVTMLLKALVVPNSAGLIRHIRLLSQEVYTFLRCAACGLIVTNRVQVSATPLSVSLTRARQQRGVLLEVLQQQYMAVIGRQILPLLRQVTATRIDAAKQALDQRYC